METQKEFDSLLKIAATMLEKAQQNGAAFFAQGDITHVREVAEHVENIQAIIHSLRQLQNQWREVILGSLPQNSRLSIEHQVQRTLPGIKTLQERYRQPILQALVEMGGSGRAGTVIDRIGEIMSQVLNEADRAMLPNRPEPRWRNAAMWERSEMVKEGLLSDQSERGIWEITDIGREYLNNRQK